MVYIDSSGTVYDASLNQTNVGANNNKFYRLQLLQNRNSSNNFVVWTRWGRVGVLGQNKAINCSSLDAALGEYNKKFYVKSGLEWYDRSLPPKGKGKYTFIERSYEPDSSDEEDLDKPAGAGSRRGSVKSSSDEAVPSELELPVQNLMELIFSQKYFKEVMADMNYDPEKLPLGKLSKKTLEQGYEVLKVSLLDSCYFLRGHRYSVVHSLASLG
jgi:poly [ADP-ribose] polymerase